VPLRLLWATSHGLGAPAHRAAANETYRKIQALPAGHVFVLENKGDKRAPRLRKVRESVKEPAWPSTQTYVYGPEIQLDGLVVAGERMMLEGTSANFVELTVTSDGGSCPHLYSYNPASGLWRHHKKVIHTAKGKLRETTEWIDVDPSHRRFRLVEQELERSFIDKVALELTLRDGQVLSLAPDVEALRAADQRYVTLFAGDTAAFSFALPDGVVEADVTAARLAVTGYYERYDMLGVASR